MTVKESPTETLSYQEMLNLAVESTIRITILLQELGYPSGVNASVHADKVRRAGMFVRMLQSALEDLANEED